jgi:transcriptional regulator with XRE-family HTH domain
MNPDCLIKRINAWRETAQISIKEAAAAAGVAQNTAHLVLKGRGGRISTLRKLCALVPHNSSTTISGDTCHGKTHSASENCV